MKKSIGKPCEGKLHARFDEGGTDNPNILYLYDIILVGLSGSTLRCKCKKNNDPIENFRLIVR